MYFQRKPINKLKKSVTQLNLINATLRCYDFRVLLISKKAIRDILAKAIIHRQLKIPVCQHDNE